ncbi:hypothetical protein PF023_06590 [Enterococcus thailandicus]|uniref:hypothetical protein n=1 Tax=Enterococcus thailandicus TaxID=417368 RepID=UPI0022EBCAC8|nr:hypothetical protein [Enterococcus thailandicus]MDA3973706.1 hypothetical protein [Enterococcus thailandicus]MDA3976480.1 hypothetical protein [Enterococcus thailandicus]MDA3981446.1 hypothetical protein [Enterococcus thailandicus]
MENKSSMRVRLLDHQMSDDLLKETVYRLVAGGATEIVVLPTQIARVKYLLADSTIQIGSVIDFPLGASTVEKKVFEAAHAYQAGARFLEVCVNLADIFEHPVRVKELRESLFSLALSNGKLSFYLDTRQVKELTLVEFERAMKPLGWTRLSLGEDLPYREALRLAEIFKSDTATKLALTINVHQITSQEKQKLVANGITRIAISHLNFS